MAPVKKPPLRHYLQFRDLSRADYEHLFARTRWIKERLSRLPGTDVMLQYSPESFSMTEVEFAKEISEAVMDVWQPTPQRPHCRILMDSRHR